MKTKKGLIVLGIAFFFLISFSMQCSAEGQTAPQTTAEIVVLGCGLLFIFMGIMLLRYNPGGFLPLGIFFLILGILFIIAFLIGAVEGVAV